MNQPELFNALESQARKDAGMQLAAEAQAANLSQARIYARAYALKHGTVTADDVGREYPDLGPAAGSLFRGGAFKWTGEFAKSARTTNHGRLLRVWALK